MPSDRKARAWLWDIAAAADAIIRFTENLNSETYAESELVASAVERKFEIIGEALSQMAKAAPETAERITDFRQIIAFVQHDRVFRIVRSSIPLPCEEVAELLEEFGAP